MNTHTLSTLLLENSLSIAVAESCTGGHLSAVLTRTAGSSAYFDCGYITYSNRAKIHMLGVRQTTLTDWGAVSEQTAMEMVCGVIKNASSDVAVAITGIAGPSGGSADKPVGTVCFGFCVQGHCFVKTQHFLGDRSAVVNRSVDFAIQTLVHALRA